MISSLEDCLPGDLRSPETTITPIAAGLSGAGVYRVVAGDRTFVLKVSGADGRIDDWRRRADVLRHAADAGLAPQVIHVDEDRRAVVSAFVQGEMFFAAFGNPHTRDASIVTLAQTLRRVHALPLADDGGASDPREFIKEMWSRLVAQTPVPAFVVALVEGLLSEHAPVSDRPIVMSHNDVNPSNLVHADGRLYLLDWDVAGPNDPLYDLATVSLFLRMDEPATRALVASYDGQPSGPLPARLLFNRRVVAILSGVASLDAACRNGHRGASGQESLDSTPTLGEVYLRLREGALNLATADGQWTFGLALVKSSLAS